MTTIIVFLILLALHYVYDTQFFRSDSGAYWRLSDPLEATLRKNTIRGYAFPWMLMPIHWLSYSLDSLAPWRVASSAVYSYLLTAPLPDTFGRFFGFRLTAPRRLIFALIIIAIYPGLLILPLTDFPAACLLVASAGATRSVSKSILAAALAGGFWYLAYNTRTIYLFSLPFVLILGIMQSTVRQRISFCLAMLVGIAVTALPQIVINAVNGRGPTPAVVADQGQRSLMVSQLYWGLTVQKYETHAAWASTRSIPASYIYPEGASLRSTIDRDGQSGFLDYAKAAASHPVLISILYLRHLINGLSVADGFVYRLVDSPPTKLLVLMSYTVIFLGCAAWVGGLVNRHGIIFMLALIGPVVAIIPGAIETRFFLPAFLLASASIAGRIGDAPCFALASRRKTFVFIATYFGGLTVFLLVNRHAAEHLLLVSPVTYLPLG